MGPAFSLITDTLRQKKTTGQRSLAGGFLLFRARSLSVVNIIAKVFLCFGNNNWGEQ